MNENCTTIRARLDDFVDGELGAAETARVTGHLRGCAACRAEETSLLALLARAEGIREANGPERDLWPGIRSRIEHARPGRGPSSGSRGVRLWAWSATAAAVLLAVALAAALALRPGAGDPGATRVADGPGGDAVAVLAAFDEAERDFVRSREALLSELDARADTLDPEVARFVADNLEIMDRAAREIRAALDADPGDPGLRRMMLASYRKRLDLLRIVREIPAEPGRAKETT